MRPADGTADPPPDRAPDGPNAPLARPAAPASARPASAEPSAYGVTGRSASGSSRRRGIATAYRDRVPRARQDKALAISPVVTICGGVKPPACDVQVSH